MNLQERKLLSSGESWKYLNLGIVGTSDSRTFRANWRIDWKFMWNSVTPQIPSPWNLALFYLYWTDLPVERFIAENGHWGGIGERQHRKWGNLIDSANWIVSLKPLFPLSSRLLTVALLFSRQVREFLKESVVINVGQFRSLEGHMAMSQNMFVSHTWCVDRGCWG